MIIGFIIWSVVGFVLLVIGIMMRKSGKAVGFYTGAKLPEVSDVRKYNRSVSALWFAYTILFELLGLPLLFLKQNSAGFLWSILGVPVISIVLMIVYNRILAKYRVKKNDDIQSEEDS